MFNQAMLRLGRNRSVIREIFEYSKMRAQEIGADKVFDFSLGNPSVPPPPQVKQAISACRIRRTPCCCTALPPPPATPGCGRSWPTPCSAALGQRSA